MTELRKITKEELTEILKKHVEWLKDISNGLRADLSGANLSRADLSGADLLCANLIGANLSRANLLCANLDFSSGLSFRCASFDAKIDIRIGAQMAYHFCRMKTDDPEVKQAQKAIRDFANKFHRVGECGEIPEDDPK